ncbi:MAG: diaminopimelate decarboxylase [Spirochaetales bacterium]|nr:diaminopimelate decarboxylase [Spirochaetales bacterium]
MIRTKEIIDKYFKQAGQFLVIGGVPVSAILENYPTPLYVYDMELLESGYCSFKKDLHPAVNLFYSMKANPALALCNRMAGLGAGLEIASIGELEIAKKAGIKNNKIIFAGPGKRYEELEAAIASDILSINVESLQELEHIHTIAEQKNGKANISIRINPEKNLSGSHMNMGGVSSPFGIDQDKIHHLYPLINKSKSIRFQGIHVYVGNQIFDHEAAIANIKNTLDLAGDIARELNLKYIPMVNLGGGLGIPYYTNQSDFDEIEFKKALNEIIFTTVKKACFSRTTFILEIGRYFTAKSGIFLTRVLYTKESYNRKYVIVDGGMNYCSMATGNLGQKMRRKFPLAVANRLNEECSENWSICGPLCTPMDKFGDDFKAPPLVPGDIIAVFFVGAYGYSASPHNFLSHPGCPEIAVVEKNVQCIRRERSLADILSRQFSLVN